jgi:hypothetical protein
MPTLSNSTPIRRQQQIAGGAEFLVLLHKLPDLPERRGGEVLKLPHKRAGWDEYFDVSDLGARQFV